MRIAYLERFSGMSGDMFLGALLDAGVPATLFHETVAALDMGAHIEIARVTRSGITATKVDVYSHGEKDLPREVYWEQRKKAERQTHEHTHPREHPHSHQPVELLEHNFGAEPARTAGAPHTHVSE